MSRNKDGVKMGYTERVSAQETAAEPVSGVVVRREPLTSDRGLGSRSLVLEENSKVDRGTVLRHGSNLRLGGGLFPNPKKEASIMVHNAHITFCLYVCIRECLSISALLLHF